MKLNKKGFVLAETLIVTVFVMVIFTVIYLNYYPILGKYNQREYYDDVDSKYYTYWLKRFIQDDDIIDQSHWNKIITNIHGTGGYDLKCIEPVNEPGNCEDITSNYREFFFRYLEETGNTRIFISKYNLESTTNTNGEDSNINGHAPNVVGLSATEKTLIPQFKGTANVTYLKLMTAESGDSEYSKKSTIENRPMKVCQVDGNKYYIQNGQWERLVVNAETSTQSAQPYSVSDYIKGCLYQAQHPSTGNPRCYYDGTRYYDTTGAVNATAYQRDCPALINQALPDGTVPPGTKYTILNKNSEPVDKESQLVDYINYLPAFKFPSTKGAKYRVIAEYKRKITPGVSGSNSFINTYSNIEVKR